MGGVVVLAFDIGPQAPIEGLEVGGVGGLQGSQELTAYGAEPALDFTLASGLIRAGVDQSDAELGAHQGQLLGPKICSIIDEQTLRQTAADEGLLEHRQEGDGVLAAGKGSVGDDAGGVVDEGDQVGLVTLAASADLWGRA